MTRNNRKKYTKEGLVIVSERTAQEFARDLARNLCGEGHDRGRSFFSEFFFRVTLDNLHLSAFNVDFRNNCLLHPRGPELNTPTAYTLGFIMGYEGLRRQAEINQQAEVS